jgi:hypothetical protein
LPIAEAELFDRLSILVLAIFTIVNTFFHWCRTVVTEVLLTPSKQKRREYIKKIFMHVSCIQKNVNIMRLNYKRRARVKKSCGHLTNKTLQFGPRQRRNVRNPLHITPIV